MTHYISLSRRAQGRENGCKRGQKHVLRTNVEQQRELAHTHTGSCHGGAGMASDSDTSGDDVAGAEVALCTRGGSHQASQLAHRGAGAQTVSDRGCPPARE